MPPYRSRVMVFALALSVAACSGRDGPLAGAADAAPARDQGDEGLEGGAPDAPVREDPDGGAETPADAAAEDDAAAPDAALADAGGDDAAAAADAVADAGAPLDAGPLRCPTFGPAVAVGAIADARLAELSGLGASRTQPGILWAHGDNLGELFALDAATLAVRAHYTLRTAAGPVPEGDFEDLAVGPGVLYLGDIGSNHDGDTLTVYRVTEPVLPSASVDAELTAEAMSVAPEDLDDAEALLLDPVDDHLIIVEKAGRPHLCDVGPFRVGPSAPPDCDTRVREPDDPSGGAVSPDGRWIALRNEEEAFLWHRPAGSAFLDAFTVPPGLRCPIPTLATPSNSDECNGEAIAFSADGTQLFTASERSTSGGGSCPTTSVHRYAITP